MEERSKACVKQDIRCGSYKFSTFPHTHTHAGGESEVALSKGCVEIQESREISEKAQKGNLL